MRTMYFIVLIFCLSCSSKSTTLSKDKFVLMNDLWQKKATYEEVKKNFGDNSKKVDSGVIYTFPNSNFPEIGFFFDSSTKLHEQFAFMDETSLESFKKLIKCVWKETEEKREIAHYTRTIKKGTCSDPSISYETYPSLNAFEVRWKK